jgi:hypothetical protein
VDDPVERCPADGEAQGELVHVDRAPVQEQPTRAGHHLVVADHPTRRRPQRHLQAAAVDAGSGASAVAQQRPHVQPLIILRRGGRPAGGVDLDRHGGREADEEPNGGNAGGPDPRAPTELCHHTKVSSRPRPWQAGMGIDPVAVL